MAFELLILGSNSAIPCHGRHPSGQVLSIANEKYLIDCGEGTQIQMDRFGVRKFKINRIFISHLHGDHVYGLPGLITTMNLLGRETSLTIYGPEGVNSFIQGTLNATGVVLAYDLIVIECSSQDLTDLFEDENVKVQAFPLDHRIDTNGYLFTQKAKSRHLDGKKADTLKIPFEWRKLLKQGQNILDDKGNPILLFEELTSSGDPAKSYAYCSDTKYKPQICNWLDKVDCIYHEATFTKDLEDKAEARFHSTAEQAAKIAKESKAGKLLVGHISSRYPDFNAVLEEAKSVFLNTEAAIEGEVFTI